MISPAMNAQKVYDGEILEWNPISRSTGIFGSEDIEKLLSSSW